MWWNVDVWHEMDRLRRDMDRIFTDYGRQTGATTFPLVNVYEDKDNIVVTAELPGMTRDKVNITFADGVLRIAGRQETANRGKSWALVRQERSTGEFEKTLRIPTKIEAERISAAFNNGILTVTMPKAEEVKPKTITIQTN
jgi:HSP20 family protein